MLTYVINTSGNKTLDSNRLFELSGYNRIRWMSCELNKIEECAEEIFQSCQTVFVGNFRVAVLVDLFEFDKIRTSYSNDGYKEVNGVDLSLYLPFIEAYLSDHVFGYLERKNINVSECSVIYIHGDRYDDYLQIYNKEYQVYSILSGDEKTVEEIPEKKMTARLAVDNDLRHSLNEPEDTKPLDIREQLKMGLDVQELRYPLEPYTAFNLYCTPTVSLAFHLDDYPYGYSNAIDFDEFYRAFLVRSEAPSHLRRYHFVAEHTSSIAGIAFDMLVLSLFLISTYEREDVIETEGVISTDKISPDALREILERSWRKIRAARQIAKGNDSSYYVLNQFLGAEREEDFQNSTTVESERIKAIAQKPGKKMSFDRQFAEVMSYCTHEKGNFTGRDREEFNAIMTDYLKKRDDTCEKEVQDDIELIRMSGVYEMTDQFPSKEEYEYLKNKKQDEISKIFKNALNAEYLNVDYSEEQKRAKKLRQKYDSVRACLYKNIIGDVLFLLLTVATMLLPYGLLQIRKISISNYMLYVLTGSVFAGLFVLSLLLRTLPLLHKLKKLKGELNDIHINCIAKHRYAFSAIKHRYQVDLIRIEEARYELRQLRYFYDENVQKDRNIRAHRELLEEVEDRVSGILNNLGVIPVKKEAENVDGEFNVNKSFRSAENRVYRVFSLEAIESMFPTVNREENQR